MLYKRPQKIIPQMNQNLFCPSCSHHDQFGLAFCMWQHTPSLVQRPVCAQKRGTLISPTHSRLWFRCAQTHGRKEQEKSEIHLPHVTAEHNILRWNTQVGSKVSRIILNIGTNSTENIEKQMLKAGFYRSKPVFLLSIFSIWETKEQFAKSLV